MKPNPHLKRLLAETQKAGLKLTSQRLAICKVFFAAEGHQSAEDILFKVRGEHQNVSLATVYRTLKLLQEYGLAKGHNFKEGQSLFEPCIDQEHHDHLICTECGKIVEFFNQEIEILQEVIAKAHEFTLTHHKMELYGLCKACH